MQNQMMPKINLLQMPDPAARTAKYVNMMNAAKQQEAAERQAVIAQKTLDLKTKEDVREEAKQGLTITKMEQDNAIQALIMFRDAVGDIDENDIAAKEAVRADLVSRVKGYEQFLPPASSWTRDTIERLMMDSAKEIDKLYATPIASVSVNDRTGQTTSITAGGLDPRAEVIGEVAPRTPMAPAPQARPQAAPRTPTAEAPNPFADGYKPNSAAAPVNSLSLVVDSALETGVMAKADFDKLVSIAQPGSGPKLEAWARQHNITIAPNAPGVTDNQVRGAPANLPDQMAVSPMSYDGKTPQSQFADMRGQAPQASFANLDGGQPPMQNTMLQSQGRTPFIARREALAPVPVDPQNERNKRPSAGEVYDTELARARAARDAAEIAGPKPLTRVQEVKLRDNITKDYTSAQSTIDAMLDPKSGVVAAINAVRRLSQSQKEAVLGYTGYLPTVFPSTRQADTALKNLEGKVTALGKGEASLNGAIGQMAVQEWRIVRDLIASLDFTNMEPADLDRQLDIIEATAMRAAAMAENAYTNQYVEEFARYPGRFQLKKPGGTPTQAAPKAEAQIPRVRGNADYNKLKPGTLFIDPNGERRRKPK